MWNRLIHGFGYDFDELAKRLQLPIETLRNFRPDYREARIPKRSGGERFLSIPSDEL